MDNLTNYVIENNIPAPENSKSSPYPFEGMMPGQSFTVELSKRGSVASAASQFIKKRNLDWQFVTAVEVDKVRVWRYK